MRSLMWIMDMNKFEKLFYNMTRPFVVIPCCVLIVLSFVYLDRPLMLFFHGAHQVMPMVFLKLFTRLGTGWFYILLFAVLAMSFRYVFHNSIWEKRAWFLWLCVFIPNLICLVLKICIGRARPELWLSDHISGFYGPSKSSVYWSLPSGHTTTIMGLMFGLCALFPRYCVAFIVFGLLVVSSRILLLEHHLSDVLFTTYLTLIEVGLLNYWYKNRRLDIQK